MEIEMIVGLLIFAVLFLSVVQFLIRQHCEKIRKRREKAISDFKRRREEVELKARRQL